MDLSGKHAGKGLGGTACSSFGTGIDQIGDGFGLRQIDFVVEKCALAELPRLRNAQSGEIRSACDDINFRRRRQATRQQQLKNHRATMGLQFEHVFAGE
ncbi:MAG: hypothetical protein BWZ07_03363 [Alphaproteobacteria bacterium ADurb.BinA280]|nr:MAG: hypothetical protein BWZ07_03363 [Alphaproteobacteria bacterium ADurb.BinA280]